MTKLLFIDVETTGFPKSDGEPDQPYIMQAGLIMRAGDRETLLMSCLIDTPIEPEPGALAVHGITQDMTKELGMMRLDVMSAIAGLIERVDYVVAHNIVFEKRMLDIEVQRLGIETIEWPDTFCTMKGSTELVGLPRNKWPKLHECMSAFFGETHSRYHDAMFDARCVQRIYDCITGMAAQ
jgi:DNA polymerase-3 subunit alpha/DNA polymerase-3 subunit epsilon